MEIRRLFRRTAAKKVLNIGGADRRIPLPDQLRGYDQVMLDIDPLCKPDIVLDARELKKLKREQFEAVWCSHNLEHYYFHEVPVVLSGIFHVLKPEGLFLLRVPDILSAIDLCRASNLDLEEGLYVASGIPIMTLDVIYGWSVEIQKSGQPFYAHKTAFTESSMRRKLDAAGFVVDDFAAVDLELQFIAHKP